MGRSGKKRFKNHRKRIKNHENDNSILYKHFNSVLCRDAAYTVQVIEVLQGTSRDYNNKLDPDITKIRR